MECIYSERAGFDMFVVAPAWHRRNGNENRAGNVVFRSFGSPAKSVAHSRFTVWPVWLIIDSQIPPVSWASLYWD